MTKEKLEDWEMELIGEVNNFRQIVIEVADEIKLDGYFMEARLDNPNDVNYAYFNIFSAAYNNQSYKVPIGVLTLNLIGSARTILRIPPRSQWSQRIIEPRGLLLMGEINNNPDIQSLYDAQFAKYIKHLQARLKRYGLKLTWYLRFCYGSKDFVASIIAKFVAEKTK
ncbi:MAG: hypothetical protein ABR958_05015 [Dehalococcoidales bacterium]